MNSLVRSGDSSSVPKQVTDYQSSISTYLTKTNSQIVNLTGGQNSITSGQQSLANSRRALESAQESNPLDVASQENTVKQREAALQDARENLANYSIRAPFAGVVTKVAVKKGDAVSGSTAVATVLTKQRVAEISLNEMDVAKIKSGQKTTLTFDAIDGLTITGSVLEIDSLGTVTQGVVTYNVEIGFDTQDDSIKPGMSVSAAIITDSRQNVLLLPNSAIKSLGGSYYVEIPANPVMGATADAAGIILDTPPRQQAVELGLANDSQTEILSGLKEGDSIITRTVTASSTQAATQTKSLIPGAGSTRSTGGAGNRTFQMVR
jgi:HlyD family secretion protein